MPLTPADIRARLPALERFTWLNAAASSPVPQPVADALRTFLDETVHQGDLAFPKWLKLRDTVRERMARFVGAAPREVAFTPSTSFGFHVIAKMLQARGVTEVLTLEGEFPSTTLPMLHAGLTLRGVRQRPDGTYPVQDIEAALTPRTGAIAVSVVQFASGYRVDLAALGALCRLKKLPLVLNAAQALGQVPLDVQQAGASFLAATSHKWLMGGYGTGLLVIREDWLDAVPPPLGTWLSVPPEVLWQTWANATRVEDATGFTATGVDFKRDASSVEVGPTAIAGLYAVNAALELHEGVGVATTLGHNLKLQAQLRAGLRQRGFLPNAPDAPETGSGICVVPVEGEASAAVSALVKESIVTTPRGGGLRLSTHVYNTEEDVDRVLAALDRLGIKPGR